MTAKEYTQSAPLWADDAMRFAMRVCGSRADSEDAVQESLLSLWRHRGEVAEESGRGYLLGATYRQLMMLFRRRATQREHADELRADGVQHADVSFDLRDAISRSLRSLSPQQRAVLQLRDVDGYSYREIGKTLDISVDQVQVYLFRARVAMRKQLKSMGYGTDQ